MGQKRSLYVFAAIMANLCRFVVAACFIFSGFIKAVDPVGTQIKMQDYMAAFGINGFIASDVLITACVLAGFEFFLGIYLLLGVYRNGSTLMALILTVIFTCLTLFLALKNPVSDCGCFGDFIVLTNWQTFYKNLILLAFVAYLMYGKRYFVPFVSPRRAWLVPVISILLIGHFMLSNIRSLPMFDFRPYKVGTDLRNEVLAGRDDAFSDFFLLDSVFQDRTADVLETKGYIFLLISPHLDDAEQENIDKINDLYYYCKDAGYPMYGVTASGRDEVTRWKTITFAEYDFFHADEIPLQTMIRSNPGVVVLRDGVIDAKWSDGDIPTDSELPGRMEQLRKAVPELSVMRNKIVFILLYFLLPYLILILMDVLGILADKHKVRFDLQTLKTNRNEKKNRSRKLEDE